MVQIVGIDLGTTNSLCALFTGGQPELVPNAHGQVLTPSVVGVLEDGQVLVGAPAKELRVTQPERCASQFKRFMGTDKSVTIGEKSFTATELSSLVLRSLKADAEAFLQTPVHEAVITVPAYFNDLQRKATKAAGELAGFKVRRIINEPTAAALTYGFHDRDAEKYLLVLDLGGGTFDVTLMEVFEGTLEIVATSGESHLGGEDFTDRLVSAALSKQGLMLEVAELQTPLRVARLRQECEQAKRQLAQGQEAVVRLPDDQGNLLPDSQSVKLTRPALTKIVQPLLDRVQSPVSRVLRDANRDPEEIDSVIFVGGATRMHCLHELVETQLGTKAEMTYNPDEVVALGAAVQAALIAEDRAVDDMIMTDVCPHTLGVEVLKMFGSRRMDGFFSPVIHRNTTIPVSREEIYCTAENNQTDVHLCIYQGESRKVKDNLLLGELTVKGIPPGPAGQEVAVRFTYDTSGILEVEALIPATGEKFRTVLTQHAAGLDPDEVEAAVKKMQAIKFYPRDKAENQRLLLYCERLVGEIDPFHRQELEVAIDRFEAAMASGDREMFSGARQGLLILLSHLDFPFDDQDHGS